MAKPKATLVVSGKGGVGKTLISVNLALYLKERGLKAGLLDADFSASNAGYFLNLADRSMALSREEFHPLDYEGMEVFAIPLLLGDRSVSMVGGQYSQLLRDAVEATSWNAEYLIVDCPAGYGDELTTAARVLSDSLLGSVIVLQPAHVLDARKALQLHKDLEMPILGLIENMTYFKEGDQRLNIFGESVVDSLAEEFKVPVFGKIPLSMDIRRQVEAKNPKLTGEYAEAIVKAVDGITSAEPRKPGFLERILAPLKTAVDRLIIELALSINKEINIPDVQSRFGYPGGSIIRLNAYSGKVLIDPPKEEDRITQVDWMVQGGKLVALEGNYSAVDAQIDVTPNAVKWAFLGDHAMSDGHAYNFEDALRLNQMKVYGDRSMARGLYFMLYVFQELAKNKAAMDVLQPLLKALPD